VLQMTRPVTAEVLGISDWVQAHEAVLGVARERAGLERREGVCLLRARRENVHRHLGYGAFAEYTDRHLGYGHRTTEDKLRTAEALEHLPELARAQRDGRLNASAVRELARVATAGTESAWIEAAAGLRVREVERLVSGHVPGDRPTDAPRPEAIKHVLRFEVSAETLAAFRDALRCLAERSGHRLDDDAALLLIARATLDAPSLSAPRVNETDTGDSEPARSAGARYQISVMECPRCKRGFMPAGADLLEIAPASLAAAHCDAEHLEENDPGAETPPASTASKEAAHVGADAPPTRTTRSIPRAVRRHVLSRDHHTCRIPGCRNSSCVEVHHIVPRAEGGSNDAQNLVVTCSIHHSAVHDGRLLVSGSAEALQVHHADGTPYGGAVCAPRSDVTEKVFRGLRWLGYKERDARAAIRAALLEPDATRSPAHDDAELLRRALFHLG